VGGKNLGIVFNQHWDWNQLGDKLARPKVTPETKKEFNALTPAEKSKLKNSGGFFYAAHSTDGHRRAASIVQRWVLYFDCDAIHPDLLEQVLDGFHPICEYEFFLHTTRSHTSQKPRVRMVFLSERAITRDEHSAVMRWFAHEFDPTMKAVARESFVWAQLMFWPTVSSDQEPEYIFRHNAGKLFDPDRILAAHPEWQDATTLPHNETEASVRNSAKKAEDPTSKGGIVGAFCRAYDVEDAISAFELPYTKSDKDSLKPRYTYDHGSTFDGAEVEDNGLFLYSYHGTDPCCERLVKRLRSGPHPQVRGPGHPG
jgi:hypothetical protein